MEQALQGPRRRRDDRQARGTHGRGDLPTHPVAGQVVPGSEDAQPAVVLLARRFVPESRVTEHSGFDLAGAVTVTAGLILLVTGIVKVQDYGWVSWETFGFLAAAALLLGSFVVIELRSAHPLVRLDIFKTRSLSIALEP